MAKFEQPLDNLIKEKLETFSNQDTPDWSFMHQKIVDSESDLQFDQKVKQSLEELKIDSPQIQWEAFVAKKNRQITRRNKIITARVIESCLILLLLWTIDNIGITNIIKPSIQLHWKSNPLATLNSGELLAEVLPSLNSNEPGKNYQAVSGLVEYKDDPNPKGFDRKKINRKIDIDENTKHKILHKPSLMNPLNSSTNSPEIIANNPLITPANKTEESSEPIPDHINQVVAPQAITQEITQIEEEIITPLQKEIPQIWIADPKLEVNNISLAPLLPIKPAPINKAVLLNVHSGIMMNIVLSPSYTDPSSDKIYSQLRPGFQTAINIGFQSNKYMLESGIAYQAFSYQPNISDKIYFKNGSIILHFNKINTQLISIPVLIHFNLIQKPTWCLSSKAGLSLSASLKNEFKLDSTINYCEKDHNSIFFETNPNSEISSRVNNPSNKGLLDGGDFGVNSYTNLVAGIRYTHKFGNNLSLYTELEVNKMLGTIGFGPNGDRFISANFNTGLSIKL